MTTSYERPVSPHLFDLLESLPLLPPGVGVLGEDSAGEPLTLNLLLPDRAHLLVTGDHTVGKTGLLRALATSLALLSRQAELQLVLIDTDLSGGNNPRDTLQLVSYLPHNLTEMIVSVDGAVAMLDFLVQEMVYRAEQEIMRPHIAIFIDHVLPLLTAGGPIVAETMGRLLREGADAGMHLVVASRRSDAPVLRPLLEERWPVRVDGPHAVGSEHTGNGNGNGRGVFRAQIGRKEIPFYAAYLADYDLEICLEDLRRYRSPALIAQPLPL